MKHCTFITLAVFVSVVFAGCAKQMPSTPTEMDRYWYLQPSQWEESKPPQMQAGGTKFPTRFVLRHPSSPAATQAVCELSIPLSDGRAKELSATMNQAAKAVRRLRDMERSHTRATSVHWAKMTADVLAAAEDMLRMSQAKVNQSPATQPAGCKPSAVRRGAEYAGRHFNGVIPNNMSPEDVNRLRKIAAIIVVDVSFASVGYQPPPELPDQVAAIMADAGGSSDMPARLEAALSHALATAHPTPSRDQQIRGLVDTALGGMAMLFTVLGDFLSQWDAVDSLAMELRLAESQPIIAITVDVKPGRELKLAELSVFQPTVTFRGKSRLLFQPGAASPTDVALLFESLGGDVHVGFDGIIYGLAKLFVMPLESGTLQELRISAMSDGMGQVTTDVAILMHADGDKQDARRILAVRYQHQTRLERGEFQIDIKDTQKNVRIIYVTPKRIYTMQRQMAIKD
ncbi:MAG: hypothetical protein EHM48_01435 [Planctomycetaceae bacterium]|nr:MAG: hypothetical protein EHM48_01435 [Planctomycetaceae bacterium]